MIFSGISGAALADLDRIDLTRIDPRLDDAEIIVASDVTSPLYGPTGAALLFATAMR